MSFSVYQLIKRKIHIGEETRVRVIDGNDEKFSTSGRHKCIVPSGTGKLLCGCSEFIDEIGRDKACQTYFL